jgi:hypothetical protein
MINIHHYTDHPSPSLLYFPHITTSLLIHPHFMHAVALKGIDEIIIDSVVAA